MSKDASKFKIAKRTVNFVYQLQCDGDYQLQGIYDQAKNKFSEFRSQKSIENMFESCLNDGTNSTRFQMMLSVSSKFKKLWTTLEKTLKPKFKKNDYIIIPERSGGIRNFTLSSQVYIVKEVIGWSKTCNWQSKETGYHAKRKVINAQRGHESIVAETAMVKLEKLEKLKIQNKILNKTFRF